MGSAVQNSTPIPSRHNPFCHPRVSGDPYLYFTWIPAFAGMTDTLLMQYVVRG